MEQNYYNRTDRGNSWQNSHYGPTYSQPIYGQQQPLIIRPQTNGIGTAGFVLALLALLLCWVPVLDVVLWLLGLIFSFIGVFRRPRGLAIAGLILSPISFVVIVVFFGALIMTAVSSLMLVSVDL